jgi:BMFP domain-containing protein YqiC
VNLRNDFSEVVSMLERERARGDALEQRIFSLEHKLGE